MAEGTLLNTRNQPVLPEDAADFFEEYFNIIDVDPAGGDFRKYFPNEGIRFYSMHGFLITLKLTTMHRKR